MILIGVLTMILAIALSSLRITAINFNRIAIILLLYSGVLAHNALCTGPVGSGVGVFGGLFQVTTITQSMDIFIYLVGALVLLLGESSGGTKGGSAPLLAEYPLIVLFTVLGMSSLISSSDLVSMYLSIELQSFAVYILATIYRESESATSAGLKYFLLGSLSSALILLGSSLLYGFTGLTSFEGLYMLCSTPGGPHFGIELSVLLMAIGLLFKVAAAPFHNWAPDVYDGVPTLVTSWLAIMPKISFLVFILEFQGFAQLGTNWPSWTYLLLISSLLSLIIGTIGGLAQYRIKRLLAYSTISHMGFLLLALAINSEESGESFLFYLIQYSLTNVNVFFILIAFGYLLYASDQAPWGRVSPKGAPDGWASTGYSPLQYISQLKGQFQVNPMIGLSLAISLFSMAGIPPLIGFFGKQMVLYSATHNGNFFLATVAILVSVISAAYYLRVIRVIHFDPFKTVTGGAGPAERAGAFIDPVSPGLACKGSPSEAWAGGPGNPLGSVIATITLLLNFFILNPTPLLNSAHILTLNMFYW